MSRFEGMISNQNNTNLWLRIRGREETSSCRKRRKPPSYVSDATHSFASVRLLCFRHWGAALFFVNNGIRQTTESLRSRKDSIGCMDAGWRTGQRVEVKVKGSSGSSSNRSNSSSISRISCSRIISAALRIPQATELIYHNLFL